MTVSDPYIKDLKGWTRKLTEFGGIITDDHPDLLPFCNSLERCLEKGVAERPNSFGLPREFEAWNWIKQLATLNESSLYILSSIVETVNENVKVCTPAGKLRLFLRICLIRKYLHVPVEFVIKRYYLAREYYEMDSIIGNEILGQIFVSVLLQISRISFKLNLKNSSFLDETWELPECELLELVPCKSLGVSVCFARGKALVVRVDENSVAAEDDKVQVGDILDEINDNVINLYSKGKLQRIMKKALKAPISLHVIKYRSKTTKSTYGPITNIIKVFGIDRIKHLLKSPEEIKAIESAQQNPTKSKSRSPGFAVQYCGSVPTGRLGDVKQIEKAIRKLLLEFDKKVPVYFECHEIGIKVILESDGTELFGQSYMEISSCGRTLHIPHYFAFISGETTCSVAKNFEAHIFYHEDFNEVQLILQSLGQGFQRTHYAV